MSSENPIPLSPKETLGAALAANRKIIEPYKDRHFTPELEKARKDAFSYALNSVCQGCLSLLIHGESMDREEKIITNQWLTIWKEGLDSVVTQGNWLSLKTAIQQLANLSLGISASADNLRVAILTDHQSSKYAHDVQQEGDALLRLASFLDT